MKTKILVIFLFLIINSSLKGQGNLTPYEPFEFETYQPKWKHLVFDSTIVGDTLPFDHFSQKTYDGWSHFYRGDRFHKPLIANNKVYIVTKNAYAALGGARVECLNMGTGDVIWEDHFDIRTDSFREIPSYMYVNDNGYLEIICYRETENTINLSLKNPIISIKEYNLETGDLVSDYHSPVIDSTTFILGNTSLYGKASGENIFPYKGNYQHIKQWSTYFNPEVRYTVNYIDKDCHSFSDTLFTRTNDYDEIGRSGIREAGDSNYIAMLYSIIFTGNKDDLMDSFSLKFTIFDKEFTSIREIDLTDIITPAIEQEMVYANDKYFVIKSSWFIPSTFNLYSNFTVFDYEGNIVERILNNNISGKFNHHTFIQKLKNEDGFLIVSNSENTDGNTLDIYRTDGNGNTTTIKKLKVYPYNHTLAPQSLYQLDNGDVLIKVSDSNNDYRDLKYLPFSFGIVWMYFPALDLGLKTSVIDEVKNQSNFNIYPNPTGNMLHLVYEDDNNIEGKVELSDIMGNIVLIKKAKFIAKNEITYDVSNLPYGLYIFTIKDNHGKVLTTKKVSITNEGFR